MIKVNLYLPFDFRVIYLLKTKLRINHFEVYFIILFLGNYKFLHII